MIVEEADAGGQRGFPGEGNAADGVRTREKAERQGVATGFESNLESRRLSDARRVSLEGYESFFRFGGDGIRLPDARFEEHEAAPFVASLTKLRPMVTGERALCNSRKATKRTKGTGIRFPMSNPYRWRRS
jgi:hypothetical protein